MAFFCIIVNQLMEWVGGAEHVVIPLGPLMHAPFFVCLGYPSNHIGS